jgi:hypothetical protein
MFMYVRDLMFAMLAWLCGNWAVKCFPASTLLRYDRISDLVTLLLFQPMGLLLSVVLFFISWYVLYTLTVRNGKLLRTTRSAMNRLLHGLVILFSLYIALIQFMKTPIATSLAIVLIVAAGFYRVLRRRTWQAEIGEWTEKR